MQKKGHDISECRKRPENQNLEENRNANYPRIRKNYNEPFRRPNNPSQYFNQSNVQAGTLNSSRTPQPQQQQNSNYNTTPNASNFTPRRNVNHLKTSTRKLLP